ncbi:hypothetical protein EXU85_32705 [Spirosoma sp. KCTC 42546]|uniref:hypothetical protein n=1 Tax=Spirosoma sp. KCTC 42546 TaxID=2520506 RepID=UPI00115C0966|nr:hypothetical protein [Spirosoma sp. KCTC 42546]QDK83109.1 hypothetical protein EXU85_32705 [Spirosoma sp. KCTC 42546]
MEINKIDSIYNFLRSEEFRRRPAMFIGKISIFELRAYTDGYRMSLLIHNIEEDNNIFNSNAFGDFVAERYNRPAQAGWDKNIWSENYGDEYQSFRDFFRLFDEFFGEKKEDTYYENLLAPYRK